MLYPILFPIRKELNGWWLGLLICCSGSVLAQSKATTEPEQEVIILRQQLQLAQPDTARIVLIGKLAIQYQEMGKSDSAFTLLQDGLQLATKTQSPLNLGRMYYQLGSYYEHLVLTLQSINAYKKAIPLLQQSGKIAEAANAMYVLARVYTGRVLVVDAVDQITQNMAYAAKTGYYAYAGSAYALLLEIHRGLGDKKSMYADLLAISELAREHHYLIDYYLANANFGTWYDEKHDYARALPYWKKALQMAKQIQRPVLIQNMNITIANNLIRQKRLNEAEPFLMKAFEEAKKDKRIALNHPRRILARLREQQNRLTEAYQLAQLGIEQEQYKHPSIYLENLEILLDVQEKQGNHKQALATLRTLKALSDSLNEVSKLRAFASIDSRLSLEKQIKDNVVLKKNSAIQQLEVERSRQKQIAYAGVAITLVLILLLLGWFDWQVRQNLRKLNQQKTEITSQAERLQELNSLKDKLFALIGHDLRGPVMNLKGSLNQLQMNRLSPDQFTQQANQLNRTVDALYTTLDNLLHWSALQRKGLITKPQWVDLSALVMETMELLEPVALQKNIRVTIQPTQVMGWADESQTQIVIRNILQNALKFTPLGGRIEVSFESSATQVVLRIADTGIGMATTDPQLAAKTLGRQGTLGETGTGLGLLVCDEFMKRNGGQIEIESQEGKGTQVNLFFLSGSPVDPLVRST